jgi:hypothetical protein
VIHVEPEDWGTWLQGSEADAVGLFRLPPAGFFDQEDARKTDTLLAQAEAPTAEQNLSLF